MQFRKIKSYKKTGKVLLRKLVELIVGMASESLNSFKGFHHFPNISRPGKPPEAPILMDL